MHRGATNARSSPLFGFNLTKRNSFSTNTPPVLPVLIVPHSRLFIPPFCQFFSNPRPVGRQKRVSRGPPPLLGDALLFHCTEICMPLLCGSRAHQLVPRHPTNATFKGHLKRFERVSTSGEPEPEPEPVMSSSRARRSDTPCQDRSATNSIVHLPALANAAKTRVIRSSFPLALPLGSRSLARIIDVVIKIS